jgi:hypothetical protein
LSRIDRARARRLRHKFNSAKGTCHKAKPAPDAPHCVDNGSAIDSGYSRHLADIPAWSVLAMMALHWRREFRRYDRKKPRHKNARRRACRFPFIVRMR